ncbi:hypothetical protein G647_03115 [Cladophialophora carrionii CBS 160.54]|uniref:Uncharacterized protein n=1 Tax=Cladophialophora carrionii CBS 160.54 TaxID=1279043 RepID=V9DJ16_9EURO|nr:uncharacterized protein G647_03115 [Cladophialophora carrionii CBS 160.54]ETI26338.1 hypothetical protein G647_03115 [Cladophialophora carrionii CBS 160.54]
MSSLPLRFIPVTTTFIDTTLEADFLTDAIADIIASQPEISYVGLNMPVDNKGEPFEYISITTLHATSEAIVQLLSRPYGFNRRLVYPMPHPYGAIGEARPADRLPINTGPRPDALLKQKKTKKRMV